MLLDSIRLLMLKFGGYCPVLGKVRFDIVTRLNLENEPIFNMGNSIKKLFHLMQFLLIRLSLRDKIDFLNVTGIITRIAK